ncbi:biotin-dependent carboxyltransferase family protein [Galbibacter sp. EGI 63066]|uniref:5-oxoprolinase subunit C family protein n=1 Tax=Galbibacter sp. EGI 63066 TaxID=2993559 RepID=UPI0022487BB7|nr:biotin-dependent carboxyltransferase family protein [Galbibacter sp. EGI 63066]MCX2681489.1 biotin-dependent carboxyltransferase family protein [Galbibacter sp. EGI 63066]
MIQVNKPGLYSTIQDAGRFGYRDKGVPISGAMDQFSAAYANALLRNEKSAAVMEITMMGPELVFDGPVRIAISGADMSPQINGKAIQNNEVYELKKEDVLSFGKLKGRIRAYLAVEGGFNTEQVMGSRSWYVPITEHSHLTTGYSLEIGKKPRANRKTKTKNLPSEFNFDQKELEVYKAPEFNLLTGKQKQQVLNGIFNVAKENNRMAYQLKQQILPHKYSILTSATLPGTVQFTPSGKLIILMKDAQTTGGYPRILQLTDKAIALLAQKRTGEEVRFSLIT